MSSSDKEQLPAGVVLREHSYDGIQEYDQRLPRWWLLTLYGAIVFSAVYWLYYMSTSVGASDVQRLEQKLAAIATYRLQNSIDVTNDGMFWEMSGNSAFVNAGKDIYQANCLTCHGAKLEGGIGLALVDTEWVHGASPASIYRTVENGIAGTGMQAWGNLLGQQRMAEVVAYILSQNDRAAMEAAAKDNP